MDTCICAHSVKTRDGLSKSRRLCITEIASSLQLLAMTKVFDCFHDQPWLLWDLL